MTLFLLATLAPVLVSQAIAVSAVGVLGALLQSQHLVGSTTRFIEFVLYEVGYATRFTNFELWEAGSATTFTEFVLYESAVKLKVESTFDLLPSLIFSAVWSFTASLGYGWGHIVFQNSLLTITCLFCTNDKQKFIYLL